MSASRDDTGRDSRDTHFDPEQPVAAVSPAARARLLGQRPLVVWFTGLSGAGKTTIANLVDRRLCDAGHAACLLDGDDLRQGLCSDLGFLPHERAENVRRVGEVAALMVDAGLIVLVSLISPYAADRQVARARIGEKAFLEVFVDAPLDVCRRRDPKRLYTRAAEGSLANFTGVDAPYEAPEAPDLHLLTAIMPSEAAANVVFEAILHALGQP